MNPYDYQYRITKCIHQHWHATKFSYTSNSRPDYGFLLIMKGRIRFDASNKQIIANPGDFIFLPQGIRYEACIPPEFGNTEDYLINFEIAAPLPTSLPNHPVILFHAVNPELPELFDKLIQEKKTPHHTEFYATGLFYLLLDKIAEEYHAHTAATKSFLTQAEELLTTKDNLSIREIAAICGVSESSLRSHFQKAHGISPLQYRMQGRIEKAKYLLEATDLSVYEIADRLGFYDEAYFCKMFRKFAGCSPKKYAADKAI